MAKNNTQQHVVFVNNATAIINRYSTYSTEVLKQITINAIAVTTTGTAKQVTSVMYIATD